MIADSGTRREFASGAVRDVGNKGRCDLMPLCEVGQIVGERECPDNVLTYIGNFIWHGNTLDIARAIRSFIAQDWRVDCYTAMLEVSIHYQEGAESKYGERNWEKGISCSSFVDSAIRHWLKFKRGDDDERHDRACLWNLLGLWWTVRNRPECNDLPYKKGENDD